MRRGGERALKRASPERVVITSRERGRHAYCSGLAVEGVMSLVRLLGFTTLGCGCVVGRYREVATSREVTYVEEKGQSCASHGHRRNHTVAADRLAAVSPVIFASKAS